MMLRLFDLAGRDPRIRFSQYCWRTKMALRHKGLAFETIPWRFTEKAAISQTGQEQVPVLVEGANWRHNSWDIAIHLDAAYPDRPPLMKTQAERAAAKFMNSWCDLTLQPSMRPLLFIDVYENVAEKDRPYFRESREKLVRMPLEAFCADREQALAGFLKAFAPAERALAGRDYLGGSEANYSDYTLFSALQWAHVISGTTFLPADFAATAWFERVLDLFEGYARRAPTVKNVTAA